jgi:hypothetical protein
LREGDGGGDPAAREDSDLSTAFGLDGPSAPWSADSITSTVGVGAGAGLGVIGARASFAVLIIRAGVDNRGFFFLLEAMSSVKVGSEGRGFDGVDGLTAWEVLRRLI